MSQITTVIKQGEDGACGQHSAHLSASEDAVAEDGSVPYCCHTMGDFLLRAQGGSCWRRWRRARRCARSGSRA